jgi:ABC-2 type transport system ATP-binding protein
VAEQRSDAERILAGVLDEPVVLAGDPTALSVRAPDPERVADALSALARSGVVVTEFALGQPSLDEVFLQLTGRPADETVPTEEMA